MAENHIVVAEYSKNRYFCTRAVTRYDYGQILRFVGFDLPDSFEVHFASSFGTEATTMIGTNDEVVIPDEYVDQNATIKAWIYLHDTDADGETVYTIDIPVKNRAKPTDQEPTPVQQDTITQAIAAMNQAVEKTTDAKEAAEKAQHAAEEAVDQYNDMTATATGLPAGSSPTAEMDHSGEAPLLKLGIPKGDTGESGVYIGNEEPVDEDIHVWIKPDGESEAALEDKADKVDTVLETTLSRGRQAGSTVGFGSFAFGTDVEASGVNSQALGNCTKASGSSSLAEGTETTASGSFSHAEGSRSSATSSYAHAEGFATTASGQASHAENKSTTASGMISHAEGSSTTASGVVSHAEGFYTVAKGSFSHVQGRFNIEDTGTTYADIVGNGTDTNNRSNASALDWEGNLKLAGDVYIHANPDSTGGDKLATEDYVTDLVSRISSMSIHICTAQEYDGQTGVPTIANPDPTTFYLVPGGDAPNLYIEWVYVNSAWEKFGSATVDLSNYVQKTDYAGLNTPGVVSVFNTGGMSTGLRMLTRGQISIDPATDSIIQEAASLRALDVYRPLTADKQHAATFYGLAKAAGDTTQMRSANAVGIYTNEAKAAIQTMLDVPAKADIPEVPVQDVQVNGVSVLQNGIANVPVASANNLGVVKRGGTGYSISIENDGSLKVVGADTATIKIANANSSRPILPNTTHVAAFYGLAKAAGDMTQSQSANPVGTYTDEAKAAIQTMLGVPSASDIPEYATDAETQSIITDCEVSA